MFFHANFLLMGETNSCPFQNATLAMVHVIFSDVVPLQFAIVVGEDEDEGDHCDCHRQAAPSTNVVSLEIETTTNTELTRSETISF